MFSRIIRQQALKLNVASKIRVQSRFLATVQGSSERKMPAFKARPTPVSRERATFTIKVGRRYWTKPVGAADMS